MPWTRRSSSESPRALLFLGRAGASERVRRYTLVGSLCGGKRCLTAFPTLVDGEALHKGAYGWWGAKAVLFPLIATKVVVKDGHLRVIGDPTALSFYATGTGCMHVWDIHLLWLDIRKQAAAQLAAWQAARPGGN